MKSISNYKIKFISVCLVITVAACGGSGGGTGSTTSSSSTSSSSSGGNTIAGTVSAPSGLVLASPVGAGYSIEVLELNAAGGTIGSSIATATTASDGSYSVTVPNTVTADSKYIVRATSGTQSMDARLTSIGTGVHVNPITDATSDIVTDTTSDLTAISTTEIDVINDAITGLTADLDIVNVTSFNYRPMATANGASAALKAEANADEDTKNMINSSVAAGSVCGNVTDDNGVGLANIRMVLRDYGNWVTRNKTKTDANGDYCMNAPDGDYVLGALNFTTSSMAASEWWSVGGNAYKIFDAGRVTVDSAAANGTTADFVLDPGARFTGTVTAASDFGSITAGTALENVRVLVRDYESYLPLGSARVKADGTYTINVIPESYMLSARNKTFAWPYASEVHDGATGAATRNQAQRETVTAGQTRTVDFELDPGYKLSGGVYAGVDNTTTPVTGQVVYVNLNGGGAAFRLRSNKLGKYRIWLKPATYSVYSYGTLNNSIVLNTNTTQGFFGPVAEISGVLEDSGGNPVSQAKVITYSASAGRDTNVSNSDGSFTVYVKPVSPATTVADNKILIRIDDIPSSVIIPGSIVYDGNAGGATNAAGALDVPADIAAPNNLGTITLPDGGGLKGTIVQNDGVTAAQNTKVQIREGALDSTGNVFVIRTRGDGSFAISLPTKQYDRVRAGGTTGTNTDNVSVTTGNTTEMGTIQLP